MPKLNPAKPTIRNSYTITIVLFFTLMFLKLPAQEYQTFKAKKGDGIYAVLKRHGYVPSEYFDQFIE